MVLVTNSLEDLLKTASLKFGFDAKKLYTPQGGEIDDVKLIKDDDVLYVTKENEEFIKVEQNKHHFAPNVVLKDPDIDNRSGSSQKYNSGCCNCRTSDCISCTLNKG